MIGERLGPYRIEALIGRGGMGPVFRALDETSGERVALKVLAVEAALDPTAAERFAKEAALLADLRHPNIVAVRGALGSADGRAFYAMELVEGRSLERVLAGR